MKKPVTADILNEWLVIEQPVAQPERDALGHVTANPTNFTTVQRMPAGVQVIGEKQVIVRFRSTTATRQITDGWRFTRSDNTRLTVRAAYDPDGSRREQCCECEPERVTNG